MNRTRATLVAAHLTMWVAIGLWMFASHRFNVLHAGGAGDVDFWVRVGDIGFYSAVLLWPICILAALGGLLADKLTSTAERRLWVAISIASMPVVTWLMFMLAAVPHAAH